MTLDQLREQVAKLDGLPDDTLVKLVMRTGTVKDIDEIRFAPGMVGGVAICESTGKR